jgi:hypothetical protein
LHAEGPDVKCQLRRVKIPPSSCRKPTIPLLAENASDLIHTVDALLGESTKSFHIILFVYGLYVRQAIITGERKNLHCPQLDHHDADGLAGQKTWKTS